MSEPNWEKFRVDPVFDPEGMKIAKLFDFMHAFIDWRASVLAMKRMPKQKNYSKKARKQGDLL